MIPFRRALLLLCLTVVLSAPAFAQKPSPEQTNLQQPKLDYSYCRFDSTTIALMNEYIPGPILRDLASGGMHPRFLPIYMTAMDVNFDNPNSNPDYKILYANNGQIYAVLVVLKRGEGGTYTKTWLTQDVAPAPRVKLRALDITGDGRPDVIASARGGEPKYEAMVAYEFNEKGIGRELVSSSRSPHDPKATFGIGCAVIDSLGRNGRPAIEVWQDDSTNAGADFIRSRLQYADSARIFLPETVDTLKELPFWCRSRRPAAKH